MKTNKALLLLFLLTGFLFRGTAQNITLVVTTTNGQEQTYQVGEDSRLYFDNGESLVIEDGTGTIATFQLSEIRKINCDEITGVNENNASTLQLSPNPARDSFLIKNLQGDCPARIYTLDGRLVKSFTTNEGMTVDISGLAPGMYLLHIDGETLKMMKL